MRLRSLLWLATLSALGACSSPGALRAGADAASGCASLAAPIEASKIGLPSSGATIDSAALVAPSALSVAERGPTPAATITPAAPQYCKVVGRISPVDPKAPPILFQVNLPTQWNGRSVQYGGGGFNGVLITGLTLLPAAPYDRPSPLAQGFVTVGTDSGHQNQPGQPPQVFALNDEALLNFSHASYKKVRDVSVELMKRAFGRAPDKLYFAGSSEGGREGLTMAQRYPGDFDGIFSRVPVIHWTGLQHAGLRDGFATMGEGWIRPPQVKLVHDAVLAACDAADGVADGIVSDPAGCRQRFDVSKLRCLGAPSDQCLSDAQVSAVQMLNSPLRLDVELANGLREYPGRGPSGENLTSFGPTGGWNAWWLGATAPVLPPQPNNSIAWFYGAGAILYFYARNPTADLRSYRISDHAARVREVSALMDSTNPDLSAFAASGGKLLMLENMADYAQSPYAGIGYYESVVSKLGRSTVDGFMRLYTAPGVDHVGTGAPANVDMLAALTEWVEHGNAPAALTLIEQQAKPPFATTRARPL
ncbi:MAG TPA: tannase/feruloyl esterase family alpha/beta hydrolase, partial [Burkholderiaceae bacterium]|nr:tannase/feruloyl esterase family alpha/beta hydrolase [Burkholderiaceae bacterium]